MLGVSLLELRQNLIVLLDDIVWGWTSHLQCFLIIKFNSPEWCVRACMRACMFLPLLADRKTILSKGLVKCSGSSVFLKSRFGIGYNLR